MDDFSSQMRKANTARERQVVIDDLRKHDTQPVITGASLNGCMLSGIDMAGVEFHGVDLRQAVCRGTILPRLIRCDLRELDARKSHVSWLECCKVSQANLRMSVLAGGISHSDFAGSDLRRCRIGGLRARRYESSVFAGANLDEIDAAGAYLSGAVMTGARLRRSRLSRADLSGCDLRCADLSGSSLVGANMNGADLTGAIVDDCVIAEDAANLLAQAPIKSSCRLLVASSPSEVLLDAIENELKSLPEFAVSWYLQIGRRPRTEKVLLWKTEAESTAPVAGAFDSRRVCLRIYESSEGLQPMLTAVAADYAGWKIVKGTIDVRSTVSHAKVGRIHDLVHAVFGGQW